MYIVLSVCAIKVLLYATNITQAQPLSKTYILASVGWFDVLQ